MLVHPCGEWGGERGVVGSIGVVEDVDGVGELLGRDLVAGRPVFPGVEGIDGLLGDRDGRLAVVECPQESSVDCDVLVESVAFVAELVAAVEERGGATAELCEGGLGGGEFVGCVGEVASCCSASEGSAVGDGSFSLPLAVLGLGDVVVGGGDRGVVGRRSEVGAGSGRR